MWCSIASSFHRSVYRNRLIDFWEGKKPLEAGLDGRSSCVVQIVCMGDLRMKTSLQKKRRWWFLFNCEVIPCHGLQHSVVSTTIPIVKTQSATSCESLKQGLNRLFANHWTYSGRTVLTPVLLHNNQHGQASMAQGGCLVPQQATCMICLRKTVISELQIKIWDRILLIFVLLPPQYLLIALTLSDENFITALTLSDENFTTDLSIQQCPPR